MRLTLTVTHFSHDEIPGTYKLHGTKMHKKNVRDVIQEGKVLFPNLLYALIYEALLQGLSAGELIRGVKNTLSPISTDACFAAFVEALVQSPAISYLH